MVIHRVWTPSERPWCVAGEQTGPARQSHYRAELERVHHSIERDVFVDSGTPGMQVSAEINPGERAVLAYVLSPLQTAFQVAGRVR